MSRTVEGRFQDRFLAALRGQGILCQKFNDEFSEGIPDIFAALPQDRLTAQLQGVLPDAAWIELKAIEEWPVRPETPLPANKRLRPGQVTFGKVWNFNPHPVVCVLGAPEGWLLVPQRDFALLDGPASALRAMMRKEPISYARMFRDWRTWR